MNEEPLTEREIAVVRLIAEGYTRWRIEQILNLPNDAVRRVIFRLCDRFDCRMAKLPERVAEAFPDLGL